MAFLMGEYIFHYPLPQVRVSCLSGTRRWTEPVWQLSDRPRHPFGPPLIGLYQTKRWQVAAALSAAVTTTPKQENAPTSHGRASSKEKSSLFPATLRERGSGGEALLLEKRPLPQNLLPQHLFGREREGGCFSIRKAPSLAYSHSSNGILERSAVMSSSSGSGRTP